MAERILTGDYQNTVTNLQVAKSNHQAGLAALSMGGRASGVHCNFNFAARRLDLLLLAVFCCVCLVPFSGKAFHIDDPLFIWSAKHIAQHPFDPFGIQVLWDRTLTPLSEVTKNPPLACYYAALVGSLAGWSERALHLGFLLPAIALVMGTYRLGAHLSPRPMIAALATFLTPGVMVSATTIMSDILMLAFWVWAILFWLEGSEQNTPTKLLASAALISVAALTKYFGICLVPLLLAYSLFRQRRFGKRIWYLSIPVVLLGAYDVWTHWVYGYGMFGAATRFAPQRLTSWHSAPLFFLTTLSFAGGCALSAFALAALLWSWRQLLIAMFLGMGSLAAVWAMFRTQFQASAMGHYFLGNLDTAGIIGSVCVVGGISILVLAALDFRKHPDADSLLLALWVVGTFLFTALLNWAINARTVLPLIPAVGILIARRIRTSDTIRVPVATACALLISGIFSLLVTYSDMRLASSAKEAALLFSQGLRSASGRIWFEGHWGFEYYMQELGFRPFDFEKCTLHPGDVLIVPENAVETTPLPKEFADSTEEFAFSLNQVVITHDQRLRAGFYGSHFGPLPFALGTVPPQKYEVDRISAEVPPKTWGFLQAHPALEQASQ